MKTRWIILPAVAFLLPVFVQAQSYEDDLYYNPKKAKVETARRDTANSSVTTQDGNVRVYDKTGTLKRYAVRDVDEYNRRTAPSDTDESQLNVENNQEVADTLPSDENGQPFEYAERIRRFYDPQFTIHITDGEYLNIYIEDGADVNVYYADDYSSVWMSPFYYDNYWYPTYGFGWNNWYRHRWGMYYDPWCYSGWGFYDPWYTNLWSYYGGWGYYDSWYGYGYGHGGWDSGYYGGGGDLGHGSYSRNRHRLTDNQRDFISSVGSGRPSANRVNSSNITNRAVSGTSYGRSVSGNSVKTRSSYGTTATNRTGVTYSRSTAGSGSASTTRSSSGSGTTTRTGVYGSSTTRSSTSTSSARTSSSSSSSSSTCSGVPSGSTSVRSAWNTYSPSSSSSSSGSMRSSSSSSSGAGSGSGGRSSSGGGGGRR